MGRTTPSRGLLALWLCLVVTSGAVLASTIAVTGQQTAAGNDASAAGNDSVPGRAVANTPAGGDTVVDVGPPSTPLSGFQDAGNTGVGTDSPTPNTTTPTPTTPAPNTTTPAPNTTTPTPTLTPNEAQPSGGGGSSGGSSGGSGSGGSSGGGGGDGGSGGGSSGDGGSGGGVDSNDDGDYDPPSGPVVVQTASDGGVTVRVRAADAGESVSPALDGGAVQSSSMAVTDLDVTFAQAEPVAELTMATPTRDRGSVSSAPPGTILGYIPVETTLTETAVRNVSVAVRTGPLPDGRTADSVGIYRLANGTWQPLPTTTVANGYRATATGLSSLAVVSLEPGRVTIADVTEPPERASPGYETTIVATVENPGEQSANRTLTVTVDGDPVTNQSVRLTPGEQTTVPLRFPAREGTVAVGDVEAGSITISDGDQWDSDQPISDRSGAEVAVVALLLLALVSVAVAARHVRE